ncbi:crossover junction endonuclease EME1B [Ricinus communis]|uniref:crossover junction endonuclease EME1B n=1 Tax=Ricinus communis TaxID=3988 RepID=UPI00201ACAEE|nr:crossover junction endonuclease EME1B [Ricinus communis]
MSNTIILSDDEDDHKTPVPSLPKKPRTIEPNLHFPTILVLDDDPTPPKPGPTTSSSSTPSFVPDTPMSDLSIVKCTFAPSNLHSRVSNSDTVLSGSSQFVCLESEDDESESGSAMENWKNSVLGISDDETDKMAWSDRLYGSMDMLGDANPTQKHGDNSSEPLTWQDDLNQVNYDPDKENCSMEQISTNAKKIGTNVFSKEKGITKKPTGKKKLTKEERNLLLEEKKQKKEQEKLQKAAQKAQAAELKKLEKEKQKWEKGKFALKSIIVELDIKVVEQGSIGGHLLTRFSEKGVTYRLTSNSIEKSIVWTMSVPEHISQLSPKGTEVQYVLLVYEAEEFCNLVINESLLDHVSRIRSRYPSYTVCYLTNRLMAYINKREKEQYKNPENDNGWRRPPIEEVLAKLTTHFVRVHYRHCTDEAELAEHVVGLTCSLASCQFRNKLTRLSVNANGALVPKDSVDRNLIKKSTWLKALVAIPKVQPRFAVAIWKKYPTMKSLLRVYMDPSKSVHEKEFLLEDLTTEGLLGGERRVGRICSKRIYRILMAQSGSIKTDDVEDGADFFRHEQS